MKLKTALTLLLIAAATAIQAQNASSFTLQGNIEGLQVGDTLIIAEYTLPEWTKEKQDTLIVQQANAFSLTFPVEHTSYLSLMHFPKTGKPLPSSKMALSFLARPADKLTLTGTIDYFVLAEIEGGFYNNPLVQQENSLEREYDKAGIDIIRNMERARINEQKDSVQFYGQQYNTRRRPEQMRVISDSLTYNTHDTEYAAFQFLKDNFRWNFSEGMQRYEKFNDEVKESYIGRKVKELIQKKEKLEVGNTPPDFIVITTTGVERTLSSYKGKHLLLYYWGMCPGSIQLSPQLTEFYKTYHQQGLEVLSITKDDPLKSQPQLKENPRTWDRFKDFLNPIWEVVYEVEHDNAKIGSDYIFNVLPTVMLISPEGITLFRGYNDYAGLEKAFLDSLNKK